MTASPGSGGSDLGDPGRDDTVHILLSTYRGARFLPDQLQSFRDQTHPRWMLHWRDDGGGECGAVDALMARFDAPADVAPGDAEPGEVGRSEALGHDGAHLGIAASFHRMLSLLVARRGAVPVAFADQDDVWLPEKLSRALASLDTVPAGRPALYCARQMLTDRALRTVGPSPAPARPPGFPDALAQNIATGCTVVLNPAAAVLVAACPAPRFTLHDWWSYLVVTAAGGVVLVDPVPTVLYRQHGGNAVGARLSHTRRGIGAMRRGPRAFMRLMRSHLAGLAACRHRLTPQAARTVDDLSAALARGLLPRLRALRAHGLRRQTLPETLLFRLWFLAG